MAKIVVDPITRIEGHLRIEVEVNDGVITDAWSSTTMWRGIENILKGRDPRGAWLMTQRICGVCTTVHALASVRAVEDALGIEVPPNAQLLRNMIAGIQFVQDHVIHFYHLHALDWVDIVNALEADPEATSKLAQSISDWPLSSTTYFKGVQDRLKAFVGTGQLGPFANAYWGHSAYNLPPEANLMATAHYLEALDWQREFIKAHAILGAKNPHLQTYLVGGMATPIDPNSQAAINADTIATLKGYFANAKKFVEQVYLPDVLAVAPFYLDWAGYGEGIGNFMTYGEFPDANGKLWMPAGIVLNRDLSTALPVEQDKVSEYVTHSWFSYEDENSGLHPWAGETNANYTGPKPPYDFLETDNKYSWLKAPRYDDQVMEVGPLARMIVGYALGHEGITSTVDLVLDKLGVGPEALYSTLGRIAARCIETVLIADQLDGWINALAENIAAGDIKIHNGTLWKPESWPAEAQGYGWHDAPRGALGHWVHIKDQKIENYQCVVPSTWNGGPRDAQGRPGPYEAALIGTPIADPEKPLEVLRTIHSFDPCMACAAHVVDVTGREITQVKIL
ncbi:MAG TPA: nickel-dependent hydrogenase large subunit [Anaerolineae bacterium]|nr:nickel-dependent hydrogenase large subunit [Anaerolineae bacterium]MCB9105106.1 nickel-dependent hydrogenase large subunit [Anaerolineales bacterium]HRV91978.1 nickel-dependent hydrogenase large subunit [Anaerolineae bacterium]